MARFDDAVATFQHAIERARQMVVLYDALSSLRPREPANDDALRSAYFQTVSSFDFFAHELAAIEARHRFENGVRTRNISLPMEIMGIQDAPARISAAEANLRAANAFKAFVDPGKLAEMLSCYCIDPWKKICEAMNQDVATGNGRTTEQVKGQLRSVWKRRNKIAHEADVNPTLAGISLWPIDKSDTELTISFILSVGEHLPAVISIELPAGADADVDDALAV
ncbi:MAG TPA: hypothetical protein VGV37_20465 [Aliidongia sp.]|uniref:hypothetical protein n=1 Tax=Aliidongia sp. TaxID=1914230 RepID=UPI002DDD3533|nr:hypothetical protein [Aliidongia sp.]HEV2676913.1 hypothetical protein [Aliidongia sp.]